MNIGVLRLQRRNLQDRTEQNYGADKTTARVTPKVGKVTISQIISPIYHWINVHESQTIKYIYSIHINCRLTSKYLGKNTKFYPCRKNTAMSTGSHVIYI